MLSRSSRPGAAVRLVPALYSLFVAAAAITGCARTPEPESSGTATVSVIGLGLEAGEQLRRDALDEFTSKTGLQVDLIPTWGTSTEQLDLALRLLNQRVSTPDVYVLDVIWLNTLGAHLLDLSPYLDGDARRHFPSLLKKDTVRGRLVGLPFYLNLGVLYYRSDLLKKYGYSLPPNTWTELENMAARIQRGERAAGNPAFWGYVWQGDSYEGLTCNALEWQASYGGGHIIEADGTISVNNPRAIQALGMASRWVGKISPPGVLYYRETDSLAAFLSGNAAFLRYWSSGFALDGASRSPIRGRFNVAPLPAGPKGRAQTMGGFHLAVSRYSAHPRDAAQLVLYLTGRQVQLRRALREGCLPTIPLLYQAPGLFAAVPQAALFRNTGLGKWDARPSARAGSRYADVSRAYYLSVHDVLSGRIGAADALTALEKQLVAVTGSRAGAPGE